MSGGSGARNSRRPRLSVEGGLRFASTYGLPVLLLALIVAFSLLLPNTFPTEFNIRSILSDKSIVALLALAETVPVATGQFDLSIGWGLGLYHILTVGLIEQGVPWPLVVLFVLTVGFGVGTSIGLLVTRVGIDSFIASLGVGTILLGISYLYAPQQIVTTIPPELRQFVRALELPFDIPLPFGSSLGAIPLPFIYVVLIATVLWIMFERLPLGRYLYMLGANQRAAELTGIAPRRYILFSFQVSGVITALAGVLFGVRLGVAAPGVGLEFLLPAFVAVLLGSTTIRPGRVNILGTLVAVFIVSVAVAGLQQMGAEFWVNPMFNGIMLVTSVGLAAFAAKRRARIRAAADAAALR